MSSRSGSLSSFNEEDFEQISNPDHDHARNLNEMQGREESPVMVNVQDAIEPQNVEPETENQRLRDLIERLQDRLVAQDDRLFEMNTENHRMAVERDEIESNLRRLQEEKEDNSTLVSTLLGQLETEKMKHEEMENEKNRMAGVVAENQQLKEAVEKLERLSIDEKIKEEVQDVPVKAEAQEPSLFDKAFGELEQMRDRLNQVPENQIQAQDQALAQGLDQVQAIQAQDPLPGGNNWDYVYQQLYIENLNAQVADKDQQIKDLRANVARLEEERAERKAKKEEKNKRKMYTPYQHQEPAWKAEKRLTEELDLANQQIGIIVEHNHYLRTIEANEHSIELNGLRQQNEQLNQTILFLKQQLTNYGLYY